MTFSNRRFYEIFQVIQKSFGMIGFGISAYLPCVNLFWHSSLTIGTLLRGSFAIYLDDITNDIDGYLSIQGIENYALGCLSQSLSSLFYLNPSSFHRSLPSSSSDVIIYSSFIRTFHLQNVLYIYFFSLHPFYLSPLSVSKQPCLTKKQRNKFSPSLRVILRYDDHHVLRIPLQKNPSF